MKRTALVSYSDSENEDDQEPKNPSQKRKRLLPPAPSLLPHIPIDDPSKHQGRTRAAPYSEGQFASYVYISIPVTPSTSLGSLIQRVLRHAASSMKEQVFRVPSNTLIVDKEGSQDSEELGELHISLSRPTFLRAHQRVDMKNAVKAAAQLIPGFHLSFSQFAQLTNDENARTFLAIEVGAGHNEMRLLSDTLTPTLHAIRQKEFYSNPRFHASIAWTLATPSPKQENCNSEPHRNNISSALPVPLPEQDTGHSICPNFPVQDLNHEFASGSTCLTMFKFEAEHVYLKIGREISKYRFTGTDVLRKVVPVAK